MRNDMNVRPSQRDDEDEDGVGLLDIAVPLAQHWKMLVAAPLAAGVLALGLSTLITPTFTARTVFLPPSQSQNSMLSMLSTLSTLPGLSAVPNIKNVADQYASILQSATVADRVIDRFKLMELYGVQFREDARNALSARVRALVGKKDGLITVEVDDHDPQRAAEMANQHVAELRALASGLALTEAQQRRAFFEAQLKQTRDNLATAQRAMEASGLTAGAIKSEPKIAAEKYATLQADVAATEIQLQALRRSLVDNAPEVQQTLARLAGLRAQLTRAEANSQRSGDADYVGKYREFKYQETLFEMMAQQYELARVDESREGTLIQVIDPATPPQRKSSPKRALIAVATTLLTLLLLGGGVVARHFWRRSASDPAKAEKISQLRAALRRS